MIDLHTHCLPGMDDGAKTVEESRKMLGAAYAQGVTLCVASPHCVIHSETDIADFLARRAQSRAALDSALDFAEYVPELSMGAEVFLDHDISRHPDIAKLCIGDSNCILVELQPSLPGHVIADTLYRLTLQGIRPIIAHVDRYPQVIPALSGLKVDYQINATRFLTISGRRLVKKLLPAVPKFLLGSDMHNLTDRPCNMKQAYEKMKQKFPHLADLACNDFAAKLLLQSEA